jgi:hypothetical protein
MKRYLARAPKKEYPEGLRIVHNFLPGPGRDRPVGVDGFRVWITDELESAWAGERCYCGWLDGREHYGTRTIVDATGETRRAR